MFKVGMKFKWTLFTLLMLTINPCKLIRWKTLFVFVIFNQNLNIYFRSGMAFLLWWRQFDDLARISLNTPLQPRAGRYIACDCHAYLVCKAGSVISAKSVTCFQMERHLIHRAVVPWQATQYSVRYRRRLICDNGQVWAIHSLLLHQLSR